MLELILAMWKKPLKLTIILTLVMLGIVAVHLLTLLAQYGFGHDYLFGLNDMFDLDKERNVPSVFSVGLLLFAAALLVKIALGQTNGRKPHAAKWIGLALVFVYLGFDEGLEIHERVSLATAHLAGSTRFGFYAWIIPYGLAALAMLAIYIRFLRQLPRSIAIQFIVAGGIYIFGALGTEGLAGIYVYFNNTEHALGYRLIAALEEVCEMGGVIWFIDALMTYIGIQKAERQQETIAA